MPGTRWTGAGEDGEATDELFDALAAARRRTVLRYLRQREETTVGKLASAVAAIEGPEAADAADETVEMSLRHVHLPKLDAVGLVDHDPGDGTVRLAPDADVTWMDRHLADPSAPGDSRPSGMRVLYVDPGADGSALAAERDDLDVVAAPDADAALDLLSRDRVDCVVSEYDLPGTDGLAFLDSVREAHPDLPVVLFTDDGDERVASAAFAAGATGYLRKADGHGALADRVADVGRDVTARHERQRDLERYERIVEAARDGIYTMDEDGRFTFVNDSLTDITSFDRESVEGRPASAVLAESTVGTAEAVIRDLLSGGDDARTFEIDLPGPDGPVPCEVTITLLYDDGEFDGHVGVVHDVSERKAREEELREERAFVESLIDAIPDVFYAFDEDGQLLRWNDRLAAVTGYDDDEIAEMHPLEFVPDEAEAAIMDGISTVFDEGRAVTVESQYLTSDGERIPYEFTGSPLRDDEGEVIGLVGVGRDITERKHRAEQLELLNEVSRELTEAETVEAACEVAVDAAAAVLCARFAAIDLYDESAGDLERRAETAAVADLSPGTPLDPGREAAWEVFVDGEGTVFEDPPGLADAVALPLGRHGVLLAGTTEGLADVDVDTARILAAHVGAALDRVDRERSLRERTEELERKNERLARMNRLNEVVRGLTGALIDASGRAEIERAVCERLTDAGPYRFAWVGRRDPVSAEVRPEAWAGDGEGYLDAVTVTADGPGDGDGDGDPDPAVAALRSREPQVVERVGSDPPFDPWRREALEREFRSAIAVPLVYEDALYGVLNLYADEPGIFDDLERAVIAELGETVGYAINAVERKEALLTDRVVELDFRLRAPDLELFECVQHAGGRLELEGVVGGEDDSFRLFFTLRGGSPGAAREFAAESPAVRDFRVVSEGDDELVFECTPVHEGLVTTVLDHGAVPRQVAAEGDEVQVVVELPSSRDVREFAEVFETRYADATLVARRERDRPIQTAMGFREELDGLLTDRQLEAAKTAYFSGFFEWPRENTGQEVAEALGVSQPTFNRHLRKCQRKLFELLFDEVAE